MGRKTFEVVVNFGGEWPYNKHVFVMSNSSTLINSNIFSKSMNISALSFCIFNLFRNFPPEIEIQHIKTGRNARKITA